MVTKRELLQAIADCEAGVDSFQNCQKLATLYTLKDHLYPSEPVAQQSRDFEVERTVAVEGNTDFLKALDGKSASGAWAVMDELMSTLSVLNTRLYEGVLRRIQNL